LFDERGNLIGITEMELVGGGVQNLNFAIAASDYWH
jgi:S1-C subfamily serine protease